MREDRELPHNASAERSVLGSVLMDPSLFDSVAAVVAEADFYSPTHRRIWKAIESLAGGPIDTLLVKNALIESGDKDTTFSEISALTSDIPDLGNVRHYAEIVRDHAARRKLIVEAHRISEAAYGGGDISDLAARTVSLITETVSRGRGGARAVDLLMSDAITEFDKLLIDPNWLTGVPSGIAPIDQAILGFQPGTVSLIGARTTVGKTAFGLNLAINAAEANKRCAYYSLEMSERLLRRRLLTLRSGVQSWKIRTGKSLSESELESVRKAASEIASIHDGLLVNDHYRSIGQLIAEARSFASKSGLDAIFVDYIQLVRGGKGEKRYLELGDISVQLLDLAKDTNTAVIAFAQLGRSASKDRPTITDIRESGNLEQDPRVILLLDRPGLRDDTTRPCEMWVYFAKNSEGETGLGVKLHYDLKQQLITAGDCHDRCAYYTASRIA